MKEFAVFMVVMEQARSDEDRIQLLTTYLSILPMKERLHALSIGYKRKFKPQVTFEDINRWVLELTNYPDWLVETSIKVVREPLEAITMLLRTSDNPKEMRLLEVLELIEALPALSLKEKKEKVKHAWLQMNVDEQLIFNKMITGSFRYQFSNQVITQAVSKLTGIEAHIVAAKLKMNWTAATISFDALFQKEKGASTTYSLRPYKSLADDQNIPSGLGKASSWNAFYKVPGIRAQIIFQNSELFIWSENGELLNDALPEYRLFGAALKGDVILDVTIVSFLNGSYLPLSDVIHRIKTKKLTKAIIKKIPISFLVHDAMEIDQQEIGQKPFKERWTILKEFVSSIDHSTLKLAKQIRLSSWKGLQQLRKEDADLHFEGIILKRNNGQYQAEKANPDWLFWKYTRKSIKAVLLYINTDVRKELNANAEYTMAVRHNDRWIAVARVRTGLSTDEMNAVDAFVKDHTIEKFGPVKSVTPKLIFEIGYDRVEVSTRHKSGVILKNPTIQGWDPDDTLDTAGQLGDLLNQI